MCQTIRDIELADVALLKKFKCNHSAMEYFLINEAYPYHIIGEGITKVVVDDESNTIIAYYTLKCDSIKYIESEMQINPRYIPCIEISRIAVLKSWQNGIKGKHLGTELMEYIITFIKEEIASKVGCRYISLHAVLDKVKWYNERLKFEIGTDEREIEEETVYMYLDIKDDDAIEKYTEHLKR
jgi:hypothetical protein